MKFLTFLFFLLLASSANATSTIDPTQPAASSPLASAPVRSNFNAAYNDINGLQAKFPVSIANGGTAATTAQGALNNLISAPGGSASFTTIPCANVSDEQALFNGQTTARNLNLGSMLYKNNCTLDNQWSASSGQSFVIFGFGNYGSEFNSLKGGGVGSGSPIMYEYIPGMLTNAPGQTGIDLHGSVGATFNGVNLLALPFTTSDLHSLTALIGNSLQIGGCCNDNTLNIINSGMGGGVNTVIGTPIDASFNGVSAGGVKTGTLTSGGSGYVDGTYTGVPLTSGGGTGATAQSIVVSGGVVTSLLLYTTNVNALPGSGYSIGNVLGASNTNLGGSGSGLQFTVNTIYQVGYKAANMLPYIINSFFSGVSGCHLCTNVSDARIIGDTFTAGQAYQPFFGGPNNLMALNRYEDDTNAIAIGTNSNGFIGKDTIALNGFTRPSFGGGFDVLLGRGFGETLLGNTFDGVFGSGPASVLLGGYANVSSFNISDNNWVQIPTSYTSCISLQTGFTFDGMMMIGNNCPHNGTVTSAVNYGVTPTHSVEIDNWQIATTPDIVVGIGTTAPLGTAQAAMDIRGTTSLHIPVGTTGQRPASPIEGMIRNNSTTTQLEGYINGAWQALFASPSPASSKTAPTIASGFCTSAAIPANNGTAAFTIGVGTSCTGISTGTLTLPAATTAWSCTAQNVTHPATSTVGMTGGNTTSITMTNYVRTTGVAGDWTDSDVLRVQCTAY